MIPCEKTSTLSAFFLFIPTYLFIAMPWIAHQTQMIIITLKHFLPFTILVVSGAQVFFLFFFGGGEKKVIYFGVKPRKQSHSLKQNLKKGW